MSNKRMMPLIGVIIIVIAVTIGSFSMGNVWNAQDKLGNTHIVYCNEYYKYNYSGDEVVRKNLVTNDYCLPSLDENGNVLKKRCVTWRT